MQQCYKISNHLTGVLMWGPDDLGETLDIWQANGAAWAAKKYSVWDVPNGYRPEYTLINQTFYILDENKWFFRLENAKTGIRFWVGGSEYAKACLQLIPL